MQCLDGGLRRGSRRECAIEAHGMEASFHICELLLSDYDIAANQQRNILKTCFFAFLAKTAAIQFTLPLQGRYYDGIRVCLDGSSDKLFLRYHYT